MWNTKSWENKWAAKPLNSKVETEPHHFSAVGKKSVPTVPLETAFIVEYKLYRSTETIVAKRCVPRVATMV